MEKTIKGETKMLESLNLIDLYANKCKAKIEKETSEKVAEIRKKRDIINKYEELLEKFQKDCNELYLSQFSEEEKQEILLNRDAIDDSCMQLRRADVYLTNYLVNEEFKPDEFFDVMNEQNKKMFEIDDLTKTVKAHLGIAKTKEEVEDILNKYDVIDKKGKLQVN